MKTADICNTRVVTAPANTPLTEVARLMRKNHVGSVVVVDQADPRKPLGIVTDRDIVVEVVAAEQDARVVTAADIMASPPVTASPGDDASWSLKVMRDRGIRRLPVVDGAGALVGIVALDDLLSAASSTLFDVVQTIGTERVVEAAHRN
ncbi:MAG TPA: CBS domain-containing protein [Usitatibacter sp.]|nr:CBS domain-containing protein [Usitatibacter sp.]